MSPKRNLFVSFAESDGGHSYLAARAMLDPSAIAHLIFRTTVAESLDAVASGQANYAVVPAYNSITQWEGATLKALATGQFEIYAQVCMPTSYVLVAHKDYMYEFVNAYLNLREPATQVTDEDAAKIYTRFLSRIFVGAQADEQYRGRLLRPDMKHASAELSRNPLRVLEEMSRSELLKAMNAQPANARHGGYGAQYGLPPNQSGGSITLGGIGSTPVLQQTMPQTATIPLMETLEAPAALVAAGLLDAPGDPEGWDQPGSLGEIVALLRKLLVLLNVYSFGSPDLPENKTQYFLVGRRGQTPDAIRAPQAAPTRIMTLVRPSLKKASADQWLKPRRALSERARPHHFVFDRPPLMLSLGSAPIFLFEGGKPKDGILQTPAGWLGAAGRWVAEALVPTQVRDKAPVKDKSLRKAIERKETSSYWGASEGREKLEAVFLGQYQTWCPDTAGNSCWCCEEAHAEAESETGIGIGSLFQFLLAGLVALTMLAIIILPLYCAMTGACNWFGEAPKFEPRPPVTEPPTPQAPPSLAPAQPATPPPAAAPPAYPGLTTPKPASTAAPELTPPPKKVETPKPVPVPVFHVAFAAAKANLDPQAMNVLASAAAQAIQMNRNATIRVVALGPREDDRELWQRRIYAVKDELVRLGVPSSRVRHEGSGPYVVTIRADQPPRTGPTRRRNSDLDSIPDPLGGDY